MTATTPNIQPPHEDVLPRCGAIVLDALLANDGITGVELDRGSETLSLRYDPRRTSRERVEAVANLLQPALRERPVEPSDALAPRGRLDAKPYLMPTTTLQRVGRIRIQPDRVAVPPVAAAGAAATAAPAIPPFEPAGPGAIAASIPAAAPSEADAKTARDNSFLLRIVQPGLVGLMDGSVSTLAPLFATAFATQNHFTSFLVGMAAAVGAAISMGFAEALSDDGVLTGRGHPWMRGLITGGATFVGGAGHALPFLIANIGVALVAAYIVVGIELILIAYIRTRFFGSPFVLSAIQVILGGALVFAAGALIGSA